MKHAIALTLVVTALGAAPVLSAEMGAEDFGRTQLAEAAAAKVSVRDAIAAAERLSNGGRVVEATYYLQRTPPSATYELRAYQKDGMWEARIAAGSGEMLGAGRTTPRGMFDEADAAELALLERASTTISKAVELAEQHAQGKAIAADLEKSRGGETAWHVVVVAGETARKVIIDPLTGRVRSDARLR